MSAFEQYADTPYQIINEGREVTIKFDRTGPTTGRVTWNIPPKSAGCGSDNPPAYQGILITLDETHSSIEKAPKDGQIYIADPTGDRNLHMGDKLSTALVVGFFVDRETTSLDITGLEANKAYFITGHPLDNVYRYYTAGVHSYSTEYGDPAGLNKPATQLIRIGPETIGVLPTDPTGFQIGETYELKMMLDNDQPATFSFLGDDVQTYQEFVDEWNRQAQLFNSPLQSPIIPNTGFLFYKNGNPIVNEWNGTQYVEYNVIVQDVAPSVQTVGDLWVNPLTSMMYEWDGSMWIPKVVQQVDHAPTDLTCDDYWYDGAEVRKWNGTIWTPIVEVQSLKDPSLAPTLPCNSHWFNEDTSELFVLDRQCKKWVSTLALVWNTDPVNPSINDKWFDEDDQKLYNRDTVSSWIEIPVTVSENQPTAAAVNDHWYNPLDMELFLFDGTEWVEVDVLIWHIDPSTPVVGTKWWNSQTDELFQWDDVTNQWDLITPFFIQSVDPTLAPVLDIGTIWIDSNTFKVWDGSEWVEINVIRTSTDPETYDFTGSVWFDGTSYQQFDGSEWSVINPLYSEDDPFVPSIDDFWFDSSSVTLYRFDGLVWNAVTYSTTSIKPTIGYRYYDTSLGKLREWNGYGWVDAEPIFVVEFVSDNKYLKITSSKLGSYARVDVGDNNPLQPIFASMDPPAYPHDARRGSDGQSKNPSYAELGVGTDGTEDERRELIDSIRHQLGYPTVEVELTKQQMNYAIDAAIESIRKHSGMAYKRGFYWLDVEPRRQQYQLNDKRNGMNKIVDVSKLHRVTSAFLSNAEGQGVYGQLALQHLYQMGTFDLISYHLVSQYIETMEHLFASQITFNWDEDTRTLTIYKDLRRKERILMEVSVERTEQALLKDRYLKSWIEKYALVQCRLMLAEIRGKYASLPGAGGGVALNAAELISRADTDLMDLYQQIEDYVTNNPEEYGVGSTFILG